VRELWADAGVIEARADRVRLGDLAVIILEHVALRSMKDAWAALRERRSMEARGEPMSRGLDRDEIDRGVADEG
jgi:hypothetical protein